MVSVRSLQQLEARLAELKDSLASNLEPAKFAFIEGLIKRLSDPRQAQNSDLLARASVSLADYERALESQNRWAQEVVESIRVEQPDQLPLAQSLLEQNHFKALSRLCLRLSAQRAGDKSLFALREITAGLNKPAESDPVEQVPSIDDVLYQQEREARQGAGDTVPVQQDGHGEQLELQAMQQFRASMKHVDIDKMIARAINECPQNPGPHNPQMLAVKSLTQMRDLSPHYLRRFAGYIETMLWLERNNNRLV